jgi:acyl-coenzyme A thioesterase PaaI-like protein
MSEYLFPPPVFSTMEGRFLSFNLDTGLLTAQFPVLENYLNPYHSMQGGRIAAAVDNTLGPLSILVAPPNVTRKLEMTYSKPATLEIGFITVEAKYLKRDGRRLYFSALVYNPDGERLARGKALHWIREDSADRES